MDFVDTVPLIKWMIGERPRAKDLPRDKRGRIIVDITHPHILEDMDYFRPAAKFYEENGCYTLLRPNSNPNSEYGKWFYEEVRRCREGYVRESDGEWVTGQMYFFLNYSIIMLTRKSEKSNVAKRVEGFPDVWEGIYYRCHYLEQARHAGKHCLELARRGCGKSFLLASMMSHNLILGENEEVKKRVTTVLSAYLKEYLSEKDGTLSKFTPMIDFLAQNTEFPRLMYKRSQAEMTWIMGYKNSNGNIVGSRNSVLGLSVKDDEGKIRGKRGFILFEEIGSYKNFKETWDNVRDSVKDGEEVFSLLYGVGTAGDDASDFSGVRTMLYNPDSYEIYALENVFDKVGKGAGKFAYFFPSYISRTGCMDKDGNSDVVKALLSILMMRYQVKLGGDPGSLLSRIAQMPITPEEAILRVRSVYFPTVMLNERLRQIDSSPHIFDDVFVGDLVEVSGRVEFRSSNDFPIREYPVDNTEKGALEIFSMPVKGTIPRNRYVIGVDPVDNDQAESNSLMSIIVFDLFNDEIVAEYTGRQAMAEDGYEIVRLLALFYNSQVMYEAHPYDQLVHLPDGSIKQWGEIKVGDTLFAPKGKTVKVVDIPMDGEDDIYKVTFADGRSVEASAGHIWSVYRKGGNTDRYKLHNIKTAQMATDKLISRFGQKKYFVPEAGAVDYPKQEVPIDAYTLGLLIAEGTLGLLRTNKTMARRNRRCVPFAACGEDLEFYKSVVPYPIKHLRGYTNHVYIDYADHKLAALGLAGTNSHTKFIPEQYLYNDYNTRLELLKGLMDGDGCAIKQGASVFVTTSRRLADDIMLLCRSLGIKVTEQTGREDRYELFRPSGKVYLSKKSYRIAIATTIPIFKLPRKVEKQHIYNPKARGSKAQGLIDRNGIVSVEYVGRKRCKCVTVDSPDGLYLIGDYVVTHNCNRKLMFSYFSKKRCLWMLADCPEWIKQKGLVKYSMFGSSAKGVSVNSPLISAGIDLINDWLKKTKPVEVKDEQGEVHIENVPQLYNIRNRALLQELVSYAPERNTDRVSALFQVMYYREQFNILYGSAEAAEGTGRDSTEDDDFFFRDYNHRLERLQQRGY